jgi:hypothetical protein
MCLCLVQAHLNQMEIDQLFLGKGKDETTSFRPSQKPFPGALESYSRKPDCFRRAASLFLAQCEELQMNESDRVNGTFF